MVRRKHALLIATYEYQDDLLRKLVAPAQDARALAKVLEDPNIGGFEVRVLLNKSSYEVAQELELFFSDREKDDLLLLYFSGHGIKDEDGRLYLATPNTRHRMLRATALRASDVNDVMLRSRSRQQVLILDCCYSGAFAKGMVIKGPVTGAPIETGGYFEGSGRVVLTASDSMQYSFEGEHVDGKGIRSVFTGGLVRGLETGAADLDGDGMITVDELYDYARKVVASEAPQQSPKRWLLDVEGKIVLAKNPIPPMPVLLPPDIQYLIDNEFIPTRLKAVERLGALLRGQHKALALAAHAALIKLATDDSRTVSSAAAKCLSQAPVTQVTEKDSVGPGIEGGGKAEPWTFNQSLKRLFGQRLIRRVLPLSIVFLILGYYSELGVVYLLSAEHASDWYSPLFFIYATIAGASVGILYAFALFNRFSVTRTHTCLIGGSWALGWGMKIGYPGSFCLAGLLGGALIPVITLVRWRKGAAWR